jgi:hypothetical protein
MPPEPDQIAIRLQQAETALISIEYQCGALRRELTELRKLVNPPAHGSDETTAAQGST